jgi:urocanate hydratase
MSINLTITTTKTSLYTLLAIANPNAPRNCTKLELTTLTTPTAGSDIYIGSYSLTDAIWDAVLNAAEEKYTDESLNGINNIPLTNIFLKVKDAGSSQTLHCKVRLS